MNNNLSKYNNSLGTAVSSLQSLHVTESGDTDGYGIIHVVVVILLVSDRDQDVETAVLVGQWPRLEIN